MKTLPETMLAALLTAPGSALSVGKVPVPHPGPGQVLVRMAAAPINPSDLGFVHGSYGYDRPFPMVPGFEGSGTVVAAGPGLLPRLWLGRRVACSASGGGTWAEYVVTSASTCMPLIPSVSLEQGATLIVNPMTALAFFDMARQGRHAAMVNQAAGSALGHMILRLGLRRRVPIIHLVRRAEQVTALQALGAVDVVNTTDPDFLDRFSVLARRLNATLLLDPVGGTLSETLLNAAPAGSTLVRYGSLSGQGPLDSVDDRRVVRFFLPDWLRTQSAPQVLLKMLQVQRLASRELHTRIHMRLPLADVLTGIDRYRSDPSAGKILLVADPGSGPILSLQDGHHHQ